MSKIMLYCLPRSKSGVIFNSLKPLARALDMEIYNHHDGEYYYLNNKEVKSNLFCKIEPRTNIEPIINKLKDYHWFVTTREFEPFCLSFAYAHQKNKWVNRSTIIEEWFMSDDTYNYALETFNKHLKDIKLIKKYAANTILNYKEITDNYKGIETYHIERPYAEKLINCEKFFGERK